LTQIGEHQRAELRKLALAHAVDVEKLLTNDTVPTADVSKRVLDRAKLFETYLTGEAGGQEGAA
jgi:hypothetical protein